MATLPSSDHKQEEEKEEEEQQVNQEIEQEVKQEVKQEEQGEEVARLNVLLVQNETKQLSGWNTIFHQDEDDDEDEGENNQEEHEVHLPTLYKSKLTIHVKREEEEEEEEEEEDAKKKKLYYHKDYSLVLWQAETGFGSTGEDTTGHVLWGASCCLAHYLLQQQQQEPHSIQHLIQNKTVMELGCGSCAVPSLVVSLYLNAKSVIATDVSQSSLDCVQRQVVENTSTQILLNDDDHDKNNNKKTMMNLTIASLDWEQQDDDDNSNKNNNHHHECVDQKENNNKVDILLAADVIYGVAMVPALVSTIQRYMHSQSILLIATRDGRRGISEFQMLIQQQHKQQFHLQCIHQVTYDQVPCTMRRRRMEDHHEDHHEDPHEDHHYYDCPDIATERRWQGGRHTIYQYIVPHKTNNKKKK